MSNDKADLILHPVRMRILVTLAGRQMTPAQMAAVLPDVPQATLYRQVNRLYTGGVLTVVEERPVRGTVEKVYALSGENSAFLGADDVASFTKDDHLRVFTAFLATLLGDFGRYLDSRDQPDMVADAVGYSKIVLHLNDEELAGMSEIINTALLPLLNNPPAPGRKRRLFASITLPADDDLPQDEA